MRRQQQQLERSSPATAAARAVLSRYGSAPGNFLAGIADSVVDSDHSSSTSASMTMSRFFTAAQEPSCLTGESSCNKSSSPVTATTTTVVAQPLSSDLELFPHGKEFTGSSKGECGQQNLTRHSSSPAGFFSNLMVNGDDGYSAAKGFKYYPQSADGFQTMANRRLNSQLSFSKQGSLSQISEISIPEVGETIASGKGSLDMTGQSYISNEFQYSSWDDANSMMFATSPTKRAKDNNGDISAGFASIDSQYDLSKMEKLYQMHQDAVPFKIRAKRGFATHPRSIAERERRTRISEKLRKLQELVPNMDKQTNTADMLELAAQHIKGLRSQVQKLNEEQAKCTCEASKR